LTAGRFLIIPEKSWRDNGENIFYEAAAALAAFKPIAVYFV
jgi:hypothetical protein